LDKFRKE